MTKLFLLGAGDHAVAVIDLVESIDGLEIAGLFDDRVPVIDRLSPHAYLGKFAEFSLLATSNANFIVSVGQIGRPGLRKILYEDGLHQNLQPISLVSPYAYISDRSSIGLGTGVFHGAIVNANAVIGDNCIINSRALVEHDVSIGSHTHVATGAIVNGSVSIGDDSFIGSGAIIFQGVSLPPGSTVPAGTVVKK